MTYGAKSLTAALLACVLSGTPATASEHPARTAKASSGGPGFEAARAVDGRHDTRWSTDFSDPQWLEIDLGRTEHLVGLRLFWEVAYASDYAVYASTDGAEWKLVYENTTGDGGEDDLDFEGTDARYVKVEGRRRATAWGYSLFEVVPKTDANPWGEDNPSGFFLKTRWQFQRPPSASGTWKSVSSHEAWGRQGFPPGGTAVYRNVYFIPSDWTNGNPFVRLTDVRDRFELRVNGKLVASDTGRRRVLEYDVSKFLDYHQQNELVLEVNGRGAQSGIMGSVVLARDERALEDGLRELQKTNPRKFYQWLAHMEPEGSFPYWLTGRQGFWTTVGVEGDFKESLFCMDGTLEPYKSFSISPFLFVNGRLLTREDATVSQSLERGHLPIPSVMWSTAALTLRITAFGAGPSDRSTTYVLYTVKNRGTNTLTGSLFLAARPFEVNPPWQWGGFTRMDYVRRDDRRIRVNEFTLAPLTPPTRFGVTGTPEGDILQYLKEGTLPHREDFRDPGGTATAALRYDFQLAPNESAIEILAVPLHATSEVVETADPEQATREVARLFQEAVRNWESRLPKTRFNIPDRHISDSILAGLAHIMVNRDGPAIQPGSRAYEAAWMRDGALTSSALLRMGYTNEVREYLEWYGTFQYEDGRIPAIVIIGRNEVNPVLELDSQGQWVSAVLDYYRFTGDRSFLESHWGRVVKALEYLANARAQEAEALKSNTHDPQRYAGLLPQSVSHEGYYPEPGNHSYWDNFWALKGWSDGAVIARLLGRETDEVRFRKEESSHRDALYKSIDVAMQWHRINYIAGCAELGDFDPSSTAIAIVACDELEHLPQPALSNTFNRYYEGLLERKKPGWRGSFSPYEIRITQAFQLMGDPVRGKVVLDYLMQTQRPSGWRQWPEAVYFPEDQPGYIGDMPHTWVAAGLICAVRAMFVIERPADSSLEVAGGIPEDWWTQGAGVEHAPTWWGPVTVSVKRADQRRELTVRGECAPPGGFVLRAPDAAQLKTVSLNGEPLPLPEDGLIRFDTLPADLALEY